MKQRGKRIRPSGKDLVFHFTIASLLPVFLLVVGLFHVKTIQQINWQDFNLSQADKIDIPYLIISFSVAILICLLVAFVFKRVRYDTVKQLYHRQKLAKMILENKWYESEQVKTEGFFKDSAGRTKEKITYFPKMYYRLKNGLIQIRVEITLGKYQDQLLHLEKKLESGLYCELTDKELKDSYVEYTLLYDTIASRISIDEVEAKDGKLRLMKNVWWEYDKLPHMLIAGGIGAWFTFPIDFEEVKEKIGLNDEYEEYAIHDYELPFTVDEYTSIGELNRLWEMVSELPEELQSELSALLTHFSSIEELSEHQEDIIIHSDCDDMYDVARYYIEETGALGEVLASLQNYIDYQAYGRDLDLSGTFISTNHGIFEIVY